MAVAQSSPAATTEAPQAPWPGSHEMPRWNVADLPDAPVFQWKNWWTFLGPGLLMGGAAIGGGEWLVGPIVTAKYGGAMLWLATLSILGQVIYNIEISRYTLYCGEPIFTGKFRVPPHPMFWVALYLLLDFGSVFPYLAASAATPVAAIILGHIPEPGNLLSESSWMHTVLRMTTEKDLMKVLGLAIFLLSLIPLIFGGKIYNSLKAVMTFKIFVVMGFLLVLAVFYSRGGTWTEILSGFFKFGSIPVSVESSPASAEEVTSGKAGNVANLFVTLFRGESLPKIDWSMVAFLSALVSIAGQGGLSNTPISNYTRDSGWGMGSHVGAIPSLVGGHDLQLSHEGTVFLVTEESLPRWKRWYRHLCRDQLCVWMPACFLGLALPSMLSVEFLKRGTEVKNNWVAAGMTADAVRERVGATLGPFFWFMTLFCGFLVLAPSMASTIDGVVRRWVDVFWTASKWLRTLDPRKIKHLYFTVLLIYAIFGVTMLLLGEPATLLKVATSIYNFALGFSCWHVVALNVILLPRELRPNWFLRIALSLTGVFFFSVATISAVQLVQTMLKSA